MNKLYHGLEQMVRFLQMIISALGMLDAARPMAARTNRCIALLIVVAVGPSVRAINADKPVTQAAVSDITSKVSTVVHGKAKPLHDGAVVSDWSGLLGLNHDAIVTETKLLTKWPTAGPPLIWERPMGSGFSAPAVQGDRLIIFHRLNDYEVVECLDASAGAVHWSYGYPTNYVDRYNFNGGPRSSPVIDGSFVYTYGVEGVLTCLDINSGKPVWQHNTSKKFSVPQDFFGVGSTPLIEGDLLIVNVGGPGGPCIVAFDKRTGNVKWKAGDRWGPSYASPVPIVYRGRRHVLVLAGGDSDPPTGGLLMANPADGAIEMRFPFRSKNYISVNAASPVVVGEHVFLTSSYRTGCVMVDPFVKVEKRVAWRNKSLRSHFTTPIHKDGYLYGFDEPNKAQQALVCVDAKTGRRVWREQVKWNEKVTVDGKQEIKTTYLEPGSMIATPEYFIVLSNVGELLQLELTPAGYKQLGRTRLFHAIETWTPAVVSHGLLYIMQNARDSITKTDPRLLCYDLRQP